MTLFHTCCETLHRSGGMKVNERRTVVGGGDWPLCVPQPWREIDAHVHGMIRLRTGIAVVLCHLWGPGP